MGEPAGGSRPGHDSSRYFLSTLTELLARLYLVDQAELAGLLGGQGGAGIGEVGGALGSGQLAEDQVHAITRDGNALVHNDLHWKNIIEAGSGAVLLDWSNANWGDAALDVALTWVILATSSGPLGRLLAEQFARIADTHTARHAAAVHRLADANLRADERRAVRGLLP